MGPNVFTSTTNILNSSVMRHRGVPDVPEDVDFIMEHLNDPNFDLRSELQSDLSDSSTQVFDPEKKNVSYTPSEFDAQSCSESTRHSTASRTESHVSAFEYDESVDLHPACFIFLLTIPLAASPLTPKFVPLSALSMIPQCPSTHSAHGYLVYSLRWSSPP